MSPDKLMKAIGNIDEKFISEALEEAFSSDDEEEHSTKHGTKPVIGRLAVAAAVVICFAAVLTSANFIARAYGIDTVAILREFGDRIVEMFVGEKVEYKGITIIKNSKSVMYNFIESFMEEEKITVLYPTKLPEGVNLSFVAVTNFENDDGTIDKNIAYVTDSSDIRIGIKTSPDANKNFLENDACNYELINDINCYFLYYVSFTQCNFVHKGYVYTISTPTKEDAVLIIENLRETES